MASHVGLVNDLVLVANRGHDSIMVLAREQGGQLRALGAVATGGTIPRHFVASRDGKFVLVTNQESDTVATLSVDPTGPLCPTGLLAHTISPNSLLLVY